MKEHFFSRRMEEIVSEVLQKKTEEVLSPLQELLTCIRNQQTDREGASGVSPRSPPDSSQDRTRIPPNIYTWISRILIRIIDHIRASLKTRQGIRFEDFYGKVRSFDMTYFQHFQVFDTFIRCEYRAGPGGPKIDKNEYRIGSALDLSTNITDETWSHIASDGAYLIMSATVKTAESKQCPTCHAQFEEDQSSYYCKGCSQNCRFHDESLPEPKIRDDSVETRSFGPSPESLELQTGSGNTDELELGIFKHLWVIGWRSEKSIMDLRNQEASTINSPPDYINAPPELDSRKFVSERNIDEARLAQWQDELQEMESHIGLDPDLERPREERTIGAPHVLTRYARGALREGRVYSSNTDAAVLLSLKIIDRTFQVTPSR
ncbi:MAG: hypothetical protein Q9187_005804 [Circinaria calcarea]